MSVWKQSCYRDTIIKALSEVYEYEDIFKYTGFYNWDIDGDEYSPIPEFQVKTNVQSYILNQQLQGTFDSFKLLKYLRPLVPEFKSYNDWQYQTKIPYIDIAQNHISGILAVYQVFAFIYRQQLSFQSTQNINQAWEMSEKITEMQGGYTFSNKSGFQNAFKSETQMDDVFRNLKQSQAIFNIMTFKRSAVWKKHAKDEQKFLDYTDRILEYESSQRFRCGGLPIGSFIYDSQTMTFYLLQDGDTQRISNMLRLVAQYTHYINENALFHKRIGTIMAGDSVTSATMIVENLLDVIDNLKPSDANLLAGVYSTAYDLYIAQQMSCIIVNSPQIQRQKITDKGYDQILNYDLHLSFIKGLPVSVATDLLHISKIFQCPDFCIYSALTKQRALHTAKHNTGITGINDMITNTQSFRGDLGQRFGILQQRINERGGLNQMSEYITQTFKQLAKFNLMKSIAKQQGTWPGTIHDEYINESWVDNYINAGIPRYTDCHKVNLRGAFAYREPKEETVMSAKDKTVAPDDENACEDAYELQKLPHYERNYLSYALNYGLNAKQQLRDSAVMRVGQKVLAAFKPEAKKPNSRLFYMHRSKFRSVLSVFEDNITRVCNRQVGYIISKDPVEVQKFLTEMARFTKDLDNITYQPLYVSFDMEGWSPKLSWEMQEFYYDLFAELFDIQDLNRLTAAMKNMRVVMNLHGVVQAYDIEGTNLEGFNGKMLTKLHVDVMHTAILLANQLGLVNKQSYFGAFIDDGVAQIPISSVNYAQNSHAVFALIELVYANMGLKISYDKTFISKIGCCFLNEVFLVGKRVQSGLKAYMKIGILKEMPAPTLPDTCAGIFSTAQGACKAGTESSQCYRWYLFQSVLQCFKFNEGYAEDYDLFKYHFITPLAMGGLGGKLLQVFDNTLQSSSTSESIAFLMKIAKNDVKARRYFVKITKALDETRPLAGLVAGSSKVTAVQSRRLRNTLVAKMRAAILKLISKHEYFKQFVNFTLQQLTELMEETLIGHRTNVLELRDLYEGSPCALVDMFAGKFMVSQTIGQLIGQKAIQRSAKNHLSQPKILWKWLRTIAQ